MQCKSLFFLLLLFLGIVHLPDLNAQYTKVQVGILGSYVQSKHSFITPHNDLYLKTPNRQLGIFTDVNYYPFEQYPNIFLNTGLRMISSQQKVQLNTLATGSRTDYYWEYTWLAITIPFHIGYTYPPERLGGARINIFGGASFGFNPLLDRETFSAIALPMNVAANPVSIGFPKPIHEAFLSTLDFGITAVPFNNMPQLNVGFLLVYNQNFTKNIAEHIRYDSGNGIVQDKQFSISNRNVNFALRLGYTIGRQQNQLYKKRSRKNNQYKCTGG